jgi:hypothetical protein
LQLQLGCGPPPPQLLALPPASREVVVPPPWQTQPSSDAPPALAFAWDPWQEDTLSPGHTSAHQETSHPVCTILGQSSLRWISRPT